MRPVRLVGLPFRARSEVGRPKREEKVQESLRWLDLGRLPDVTFWHRARPGVDFRFFSKIFVFSNAIGEFCAFCEYVGPPNLRCLVFFDIRDRPKSFLSMYAATE